MAMYAINFTEVVLILVAGALVMVPLVGLTLRFTVPPIVEAVARSRRVEAVEGGTAPTAHAIEVGRPRTRRPERAVATTSG